MIYSKASTLIDTYYTSTFTQEPQNRYNPPQHRQGKQTVEVEQNRMNMDTAQI